MEGVVGVTNVWGENHLADGPMKNGVKDDKRWQTNSDLRQSNMSRMVNPGEQGDVVRDAAALQKHGPVCDQLHTHGGFWSKYVFIS